MNALRLSMLSLVLFTGCRQQPTNGSGDGAAAPAAKTQPAEGGCCGGAGGACCGDAADGGSGGCCADKSAATPPEASETASPAKVPAVPHFQWSSSVKGK